jgi:hypothetical protein
VFRLVLASLFFVAIFLHEALALRTGYVTAQRLGPMPFYRFVYLAGLSPSLSSLLGALNSITSLRYMLRL